MLCYFVLQVEEPRVQVGLVFRYSGLRHACRVVQVDLVSVDLVLTHYADFFGHFFAPSLVINFLVLL